ncbi:MAG: PilZ domain-containing protein [Candidatus Omnitrophica bacterium]|nr:PilZ domain-containing protein [Candidatus Omnitrophota bacterium]
MNIKVIKKNIGDVKILELISDTQGEKGSAVAGKIDHLCGEKGTKALLFHTQSVNDLSHRMAQSIIRSMEKVPKSAVIAKDPAVMAVLEDFSVRKRLSIFQDEDDATFFFAREMALDNKGKGFDEKRKADRLPLVLPLHFHCEMDDSKELFFFGVVTNLSETGLYARFIESGSERLLIENLNPYDLKLLHMNLFFSPMESIALKGKMIRYDGDLGGIGIEFYELGPNEMVCLNQWIYLLNLNETGGTNGQWNF